MDAKKKKSTSRIITKSPIRLAKIALEAAEKALPKYSSTKSRQDFSQAQIFAVLVLKAFFKTDYRGIIDLLGDFSDLRACLGLSKLPHYSTLCYAEERLLKKGPSSYFNKPSSIEPRIWALLATSQKELSTPRASKLDTFLDIINIE
jgi:hypothetical protein